MLRRLVEPSEEAKVGDEEARLRAGRGHEQVARLDVAVQHAVRMHVRQPAEQLRGEAPMVRLDEQRARALLAGDGPSEELAALRKLLDEPDLDAVPRQPCRPEGVARAHHVRVVEVLHERRLGAHVRLAHAVAAAHLLDGHHLTRALALCEVHGRERSRLEHLVDAVRSVEGFQAVRLVAVPLRQIGGRP